MTSNALIEDWMEKWEPNTTHGRPIVAVTDLGGRIEAWALASNGSMATYPECYLVPKTQPKSRDWPQVGEKVNLGAKVVCVEPKNKSQKTDECFICGSVIEYGECECTDD